MTWLEKEQECLHTKKHIDTTRKIFRGIIMGQFDAPVSAFRETLRKAGDRPVAFDYEGKLFQISSTYGETDLIPCYKQCPLNSGYYALCSPREPYQKYLEIVYQCSYCDHMLIRTYAIEQINQYSANEREFVGRLINDVLMKRVKESQKELEKRK